MALTGRKARGKMSLTAFELLALAPPIVPDEGAINSMKDVKTKTEQMIIQMI